MGEVLKVNMTMAQRGSLLMYQAILTKRMGDNPFLIKQKKMLIKRMTLLALNLNTQPRQVCTEK